MARCMAHVSGNHLNGAWRMPLGIHGVLYTGPILASNGMLYSSGPNDRLSRAMTDMLVTNRS